MVGNDIIPMQNNSSDRIVDFWNARYLHEFIPAGGSKIKFVTGLEESGKTSMLRQATAEAKEAGFLTVFFSARDIWLYDFKFVFFEILRQARLEHLIIRCSDAIIRQMGFDSANIPTGKTFIDFLASENRNDALERLEIRNLLRKRFKENPVMDNSFAIACSLLCGDCLGQPKLEPESKEHIFAWLTGQKGFRVTSLRPLGFSPVRISKFNARRMLMSLCELARISGYAGLFIAIDDVDVLVDKANYGLLHYTKMRREDTYESIRELVDDIDNFNNIMFVFGFDRSLIDDEKMGLKSYQALWMRIQNEVVSERFNKFADVIDLNRLASSMYTPEMLIELSQQLCSNVKEGKIPVPINADMAEQILTLSRLNGKSIPLLVRQATLGSLMEKQEQ
jgi:hypothetical protein